MRPPGAERCGHQGQSGVTHLVGDGGAGLVQDRPGVVAGGPVGAASVVLEERQLKYTGGTLLRRGCIEPFEL